MSIAGIPILELAGMMLGFIFTIMVFSYLLGDNPFFRLSLHIFIGVAAGFALVVVYYNVFLNQIVFKIVNDPGASIYLVVPPVLMGIWLLTKLSPRLAWVGNPVMAYLVGVAAATAIGGAVIGTLFPQIGASTHMLTLRSASGTIDWTRLLMGFLILAGVILTLLYFYFGVRQIPDEAPRRPRWIEEVAGVGQLIVAMTFGVMFAGVYSASLSALIERMKFLLDSILRFF